MPIKPRVIQFLAVAAALPLLAQNGKTALDPDYVKSVEDYRTRLENSIKSDTGWLTVAGLHWLEEGDTKFGADPKLPFVLPAGKAAPLTGVFSFDGENVRVRAAIGVPLLVNGQPPTDAPLVNDANEKQDMITLGDLSMYVIERGGKVGIRLKDKSSKYRQAFSHRSWFPVKPEYRVAAKFYPFAEPKKVKIPTVIEGVVEDHESPGEVEFTLGGKTHRTQVLKAGNNQVWLIFRDQSSGKATYPAGRFLYGELKDGIATLDFNRAYNPPCAFTPFATCPLPPRQNSLAIAVEAGELTYHLEP